ncbi:MAG: hypothetical protein JNK82_38560, partial [Myxococcaceae bacterium]|nr:hypothetical protein [Myxococcaceae bacterium]
LPFREDRLDEDAVQLSQVYYDRGMMNVSVRPSWVKLQAPGAVELVFTIVEGEIFKIGKLTFSGVALGPDKEVMKGFESKPGGVLSRAALRRDIDRLRDRASAKGFNVNVLPVTNVDPDKKIVDVELQLEKLPGPINF